MRTYTASYKISAFTTARTLMYLTAPADLIAKILSASVSSPDEDVSEQIDCTFQRISSLGTPTKIDVTAAKHEEGDAAATATTHANVTASEPTYAANTEMGRDGSPSVMGWKFEPVSKEEEITVSPSQSIGLRLLTAMGTSKALNVRITFGEIGG